MYHVNSGPFKVIYYGCSDRSDGSAHRIIGPGCEIKCLYLNRKRKTGATTLPRVQPLFSTLIMLNILLSSILPVR